MCDSLTSPSGSQDGQATGNHEELDGEQTKTNSIGKSWSGLVIALLCFEAWSHQVLPRRPQETDYSYSSKKGTLGKRAESGRTKLEHIDSRPFSPFFHSFIQKQTNCLRRFRLSVSEQEQETRIVVGTRTKRTHSPPPPRNIMTIYRDDRWGRWMMMMMMTRGGQSIVLGNSISLLLFAQFPDALSIIVWQSDGQWLVGWWCLAKHEREGASTLNMLN